MKYKKLILIPFLPVLLITNLQALELSNSYNSVGASYEGSFGDDKISGYSFGVSSEIFETPFIIGLNYASAEIDEIDNDDTSSLNMETVTYSFTLGYAYSVSPDFDLIPAVSYARADLDFVNQKLLEMSSITLGVTGRYKVYKNSILSLGVSFTDVSLDTVKALTASSVAALGGTAKATLFTDSLKNNSDSDWQESFTLGYEIGLTEEIILDLIISTAEFDTYNYALGVSWSWGS
jgi:hypothetical protein